MHSSIDPINDHFFHPFQRLEYEGLELPKLEEAVTQLQARLGEAQRERRHAQIEKARAYPHT